MKLTWLENSVQLDYRPKRGDENVIAVEFAENFRLSFRFKIITTSHNP